MLSLYLTLVATFGYREPEIKLTPSLVQSNLFPEGLKLYLTTPLQ